MAGKIAETSQAYMWFIFIIHILLDMDSRFENLSYLMYVMKHRTYADRGVKLNFGELSSFCNNQRYDKGNFYHAMPCESSRALVIKRLLHKVFRLH